MLSCLIGFTLLISSMYMIFEDKQSVVFQRFTSQLNESQRKIYDNIVKERITIYVTGSALGLLLGFMFYFKNLKDPYRICKFLCIVYVIKLGFYYLSPKQPLMLYSLTNQKQVETWADMYSHMKQKYKNSLIVGFVGYLLIGWGACRLK